MDEESLRNFLECPICRIIVPDTEYFVCQNGHTICANCHSQVNDCCPQCKATYHKPATRQRVIEEMVDQQLDMELPCRNFVFGCRYISKKAERVTHQKDCKFVKCFCPYSYCHVALSHHDLVLHAEKCHKALSSICDLEGKAYAGLYMKLSDFETSHYYPLRIFRIARLNFIINRRFCDISKNFYCAVIVDASKEVAERYKAELRFGRQGSSQLTWIGRVFSTEDTPDSLWQSPDCLMISKGMTISMLRPVPESGKDKARGFTHILDCDISLQPVNNNAE